MADLDYAKLWTTLMRTGINQRFSQIRSEFFMKIATSGPRKYKGQEDLDKIIGESEDLSGISELKELVNLAVSPDDEFKHYRYEATGNNWPDFAIEYFANVSRGISKEFVDYIADGHFAGISKVEDVAKRNYNIDGYCLSTLFSVDETPDESGDENAEDDAGVKISKASTLHLIIIGEGTETVTPDNYPSIIKHELSHACLFELREIIKLGFYDVCKVPATWTDEEILQWRDDIIMLRDVLEDTSSPEGETFSEFVCEFLMYESDGQTKEKNPVMESRVPRTTKSDAKPKVTYRTLTPLERFDEHLGAVSPRYRERFQEIVDTLRPLYDKYDEFLDSVKM